MTVGIRGMGLIGGSFEKAFAAAGHEVLNLKGADGAAIGRCELVIVALPPQVVAPWIKENARFFGEGAMVTDAAGIKREICEALEAKARAAKWTYIGGHPMAGREVSGYENALSELFRGASMILTPYEWTRAEEVERLKAMLAPCGFGRFTVTDAAQHDLMIAYTSQLAHVVSSAYVRDELAQVHAGFSAGSFQDMTRVATVDPVLWTELFLANRDALDEVLSRLIGRLLSYRDAINSADAMSLMRLLEEGRKAKEASK